MAGFWGFGVYLTAADLSPVVTVYFLKDIVSGAKKHIQMRSVVHISCPAYENLSLE